MFPLPLLRIQWLLGSPFRRFDSMIPEFESVLVTTHTAINVHQMAILLKIGRPDEQRHLIHRSLDLARTQQRTLLPPRSF